MGSGSSSFNIVSYREELTSGEISLLVAPSREILSATEEIVRYFTEEEELYTIYVTISRPYANVDRSLQKAGIDTSKIFYLDGASRLSGSGSLKQAENVVYFHPQQMTQMSIALKKAVESISKDQETLLVFDALSTLMIYKENDAVSHFVHALTTKMRDWNVISILLTMQKEMDEDMQSPITRFADHVVNLEEID